MIIVEKNKGQKIGYTEEGTVLTFGEEELILDLAEIQDDWKIHITICYDRRHRLTTGKDGATYVAEIDIPAREWIEGDEESTPAPLDMEKVTLTLWSIENAVDEEEEENGQKL